MKSQGRVRVVLALAAVAAAVAALAGPRADVASACSCGMLGPGRSLRHFDAAFVGRPLSHRLDRPFVIWTFQVERAIKGALPDPILVRAPYGGSACGLGLEGNPRIGLFLRYDDQRYKSASCYEADPDELARYALPQARVLGRSRDESVWPWWPVAIGAGALVTLMFGVLGFRRRA